MNLFQKDAETLKSALDEFQSKSAFKPQNLIVIGMSSSEVAGGVIGAATNMDVSRALVPVMLEWADKNGIFIAAQCCEHINRCLVVERGCAERYGLEAVNVAPYEKGGGALAAAAMELFADPVAVESLEHKAHGGVDIGNTFIGMHLRRVAVCVRLDVKMIGAAAINCVRTRPALVGGERAKYNPV